MFYILKPLIPRWLQISLRRQLVSKQREKYQDIWPILSSAAKKPKHWKGWPDEKKFALVLTHDVELRNGHDKCRSLMKIEKTLGFRSSYNFVPERYNVSDDLRKYLVDNGFEVGVHGLNHDGKLFSSKSIFDERSKKINDYIKKWNVVGFRAPAMHHNLDWLQQLDIEYDLSTFDTDPFEPQSDGVGTIFPFLVARNGGKEPYVEMPYTLVQDFTLFILLKEKNNRIWEKKLDWIAENGGAAILNVHPDYINFENITTLEEYPIKYYIEFLKFVKQNYTNDYWNVLPWQLSSFWRKYVNNTKI